MRIFLVLAFATLSFANAAYAQTVPAECTPNLTKFDVCAAAREIQRGMAPNLPQRLNANMTLMSVVAFGPRLGFSIIWHMNQADVTAALRSGSMSRSEFEAKLAEQSRTSQCGVKTSAAFVGLGGVLQINYRTEDGVPLEPIIIDRC